MGAHRPQVDIGALVCAVCLPSTSCGARRAVTLFAGHYQRQVLARISDAEVSRRKRCAGISAIAPRNQVPITKVVPGNNRALWRKVGALVSTTGDFQANCASRCLTVSPAGSGLDVVQATAAALDRRRVVFVAGGNAAGTTNGPPIGPLTLTP